MRKRVRAGGAYTLHAGCAWLGSAKEKRPSESLEKCPIFQTACCAQALSGGLAAALLVDGHHFGQHTADGADAGVVGGV